MADAKPVTKVTPVTNGKPNELVAVTCPICNARTYRKDGEGCPGGCKPKATERKTEDEA